MQINNSRELAQCSLKPPNDNFLKFIFINENLNAIFVVIFHAIKVQKCINEGSMHKNEENFFWHWKLPEKKNRTNYDWMAAAGPWLRRKKWKGSHLFMENFSDIFFSSSQTRKRRGE